MVAGLGACIVVALTGCGGSADEAEITKVVYDEAKDGALPFTLDFLAPAELAKYTVQLSVGTNIVKGSSDTGEAILLKIPAGTYLQSVSVDFTNHTDGNSLGVYVERFPYDGSFFSDAHPMSTVGQYSYAVLAPNTTFGNGDYDLRIGTAVSGASTANEFSLGIHVAKQ